MKRKLIFQIGDKPGWKTPVLNIINTASMEVISVRIGRKKAEWLKARGVHVEG